MQPATSKPAPNPLVKLALEFLPLAVFLIGFGRFDIFVATAAFMVATIIVLVVSWIMLGRLPIMPQISASSCW